MGGYRPVLQYICITQDSPSSGLVVDSVLYPDRKHCDWGYGVT